MVLDRVGLVEEGEVNAKPQRRRGAREDGESSALLRLEKLSVISQQLTVHTPGIAKMENEHYFPMSI